MSLKEVCDLSSLLTHSDLDAEELQRKYRELDIAIEQQEQRVRDARPLAVLFLLFDSL